MWKGQYDGREVAAKALRISLSSTLDQIRRVSCPEIVTFANRLTAPGVAVLQGSNDMEHPPSSKRIVTGRRDDDRAAVCDGIGVDGKWKHQHVREGKCRC